MSGCGSLVFSLSLSYVGGIFRFYLFHTIMIGDVELSSINYPILFLFQIVNDHYYIFNYDGF